VGGRSQSKKALRGQEGRGISRCDRKVAGHAACTRAHRIACPHRVSPISSRRKLGRLLLLLLEEHGLLLVGVAIQGRAGTN